MKPDLEEIEIVEVIGLDEDAAPPASAEEVDVDFAEGAEPFPGAPEEAGSQESPATEGEVQQERFLRLRADFENFRRRSERERDEYRQFATASLVGRLLHVLDNFERALLAMDGAPETLRSGITLIHRQFAEELKREGLLALDVVGHPFDPSLHEAVATEAGGDVAPNTVVAELQRGYLFNDRLLRPALVRVSVAAETAATAPRSGEES